eukprot:jgi/Chlat1/3668/Chrsp24S03856
MSWFGKLRAAAEGRTVLGSARAVHSRLVGRNYNDFHAAVERLERVARQAKGPERAQALMRWGRALRELNGESNSSNLKEDGSAGASGEQQQQKEQSQEEQEKSQAEAQSADEVLDSEDAVTVEKEDAMDDAASDASRASSLQSSQSIPIQRLAFYDARSGSPEALTFKDVFLRSRALELLVTNFVEDAPDNEERRLLLELFEECLVGGEEAYQAVLTGIVKLSAVSGGHDVEVQISKQELLDLACGAVAALKISPERERLDALINKAKSSERTKEVLELSTRVRAHADRRYQSASEKAWEDIHKDKLARVAEAAAALQEGISALHQKRADNKQHKDEAADYCARRMEEVAEAEKIGVCTTRQAKQREEREEFEGANAALIKSLALKEKEMAISTINHMTELEVVHQWEEFLQDTWRHQSALAATLSATNKAALITASEDHLKAAAIHVTARCEEASTLLRRLKFINGELETLLARKNQMAELNMEEEVFHLTRSRRALENKYLEVEGQLVGVFAAVDAVRDEVDDILEAERQAGTLAQFEEARKQFEAATQGMEKLRSDFKASPRPVIEVPTQQEAEAEARAEAAASAAAAEEAKSAAKSPSEAAPVKEKSFTGMLAAKAKSFTDAAKSRVEAVSEQASVAKAEAAEKTAVKQDAAAKPAAEKSASEAPSNSLDDDTDDIFGDDNDGEDVGEGEGEGEGGADDGWDIDDADNLEQELNAKKEEQSS